MKRVLLAMTAALALVVPATANAALISYSTVPGGTALDGKPVSATASFTTSNGSVAVVLDNLLNDPTASSQAISGIIFTIAGATTGSLTSSTGVQRDILNNGTYTDAPAGSTEWTVSFGAGQFNLTALGAPNGAQQMIIGGPNGSNVYGSANGSINGNNGHNPFLAPHAEFVLAGTGITSQSLVTGVTFLFGSSGDPVASVLNTPPPTAVPEPTSMVLLGSGLVALATRLRRKK